MSDTADNWAVQILAPQESDATFRSPDDGGPVERHSAPVASRRGERVVNASVEAIKANWNDTVRKLTEIGEGLDSGSSGWGVSQIEVGLTLSATGQLLFIAEASAEASVKITLTRRPA